jgi:hypothetical protein
MGSRGGRLCTRSDLIRSIPRATVSAVGFAAERVIRAYETARGPSHSAERRTSAFAGATTDRFAFGSSEQY